jgi:hypothetical protein
MRIFLIRIRPFVWLEAMHLTRAGRTGKLQSHFFVETPDPVRNCGQAPFYQSKHINFLQRRMAWDSRLS